MEPNLRPLITLKVPRVPSWQWPDARGYIALGSWLLVVFIFLLIKEERELLESDAFLILATAVVITGWCQGPVTWAFGSNKTSGELAERNAGIVERQAEFSNAPGDSPQPVEVVNNEDQAVPVKPGEKG